MVIKNPTTDKTLGIPPVHPGKFADVKKLAEYDFVDRHKNAKRKKKEKIAVPKFRPGDRVVLLDRPYRSDNKYYLVEVVDFEHMNTDSFTYYGILLRTTDSKKLGHIGRLTSFSGGWFQKTPANVPEESINWEQGLKNDRE